MKSLFGGSAVAATALLVGSLTISPTRLEAETLSLQINQQLQNPKPDLTSVETVGGVVGSSMSTVTRAPSDSIAAAEEFVSAPAPYVATAYSLRGRTASGRQVSRGLIAADPRVLPLGSRVRLDAGFLSGEYLVADTGGAVRGKRIDIWTPTSREAFKFGRRKIKLTVLSYGPKGSNRRKAAK